LRFYLKIASAGQEMKTFEEKNAAVDGSGVVPYDGAFVT
jgi:hypothetical protein